MRRREILTASTSVAAFGLLQSRRVAAAGPCPPPSIGLEGERFQTLCRPGSEPQWFQSMDDRTWVEIAGDTGTRVIDVLPSPTPPGNTGPSAIFTAWTGGCSFGTEYLLPCQGGHADYYGNEIYALDIGADSPAWQRIVDPTPNSQISTSDYSSNAPYTAYADGGPRATHGWFSTLVNASGRIFRTQVQASPSGSTTSECYSIQRRNLAAGWTYHGRLWTQYPSSFGYQSGPGAYDTITDTIWRAGDFADANGITGFVTATAEAAGEAAHSGPQIAGGRTYNVYMGPNNSSNGWSAICTHTSPRVWIMRGAQGGVIVYNVESPGTSFVTRTPSGIGPPNAGVGMGAVYHAPSRAILVGGVQAGGGGQANVWKLSVPSDPFGAAFSWSQVSPNESNTVIPTASGAFQGTFSKFQMIQLGERYALVMGTRYDGPTYVYKLPAAL